MKKIGFIGVSALVVISCSGRRLPPIFSGTGVEIVEVSLTANGPGHYGAGLDVSPAGKVSGSDVDGTPNPFVHFYDKQLDDAQTRRIFDLAKTILRKDAGRKPIIDRNNIVYIVIRTSDGQWHTYFRDRGGTFEMDELNELDRALKAIELGPTVHWL